MILLELIGYSMVLAHTHKKEAADRNRRGPEKEATYLDQDGHPPLEEKVAYPRYRWPPSGSIDPAISSTGSGSSSPE